MKLYLVWNEAKKECVGFENKSDAEYAKSGSWDYETLTNPLSEHWLDLHGDEQCTITEIEV